MVNFDKVEKEFNDYVNNYDLNDSNINYKYYHSKRVMQNCISLAKNIGLSIEEVLIAGLIGLLHDIGRFEQYKVYNTFNDSKSIDHGDYAIDILFKDKYIRSYIVDNSYDEIIKKSILYHNKHEIGECDEKELLFCKIIRDADKLDIFKHYVEDSKAIVFKTDNVTENVYKSFFEKKALNFNDIKTSADMKILQVSMFFDLNFKYSYDIIKEKDYFNILIDRYIGIVKNEETIEKYKEIKKFMNEYLESR